jgi:copper(I)-binding protein
VETGARGVVSGVISGGVSIARPSLWVLHGACWGLGNYIAVGIDQTLVRMWAGRAMVPAIVMTALLGCGSGVANSPSEDVSPVETSSVDVSPVETSPPEVRAVDMWVRMPAVGQSVAAAYGMIINDTLEEVTVVAVRSDLGRAELHETTADPQGVMRMRHRTEGFVLAPGASLILEPGGAHVMLFDVDMLGLRLAQTVNLQFEIAEWGTLEVAVPVRELDEDSEHDHGEHSDHIFGEAGESLDVNALHRLDDDLHAGIFDPVTQRQVVADALATLADIEVPLTFDRDALISALENLDQALIAGDIATAAQWAFMVHDLAHALTPDHSH